MKIAVITPYYKEPASKLQRCHNSVRTQGPAATHFMVADGHANPMIDEWDAIHIKLPVGANDSGDTPRMIGLSLAAARGYDAFLFLDGDNWFEPGHLSQMIRTQQQTGAPVVTCPRILRRLDGSAMGVCPESDGVQFNDFNCYLFTRAALPWLTVLSFGHTATAYFTDRRLWMHLRSVGCRIARAPQPTLNYETTRAMHYEIFGETPPPEARITYFDKAKGKCINLTVDEWRAFRQANPHLKFGAVEDMMRQPGG